MSNKIEYGDRTSSVWVSWKPRFPEESKGKVLLSVFFDAQSALFIEFLEHKRAITSDVYCETFQSRCSSTKSKRQVQLMEGIVLPLQGHAKQAKFRWEQLDHPLYSLDMSPWDFHVFGSLKNI